METKNTFTATGVIKEILPMRSGANWRSQAYILDISDKYKSEKFIYFEVMGDTIEKLNIQLGRTYTLNFNVESKQYMEKWFTNVRAWSAKEVVNEQPEQTNQAPQKPAPAAPASPVNAQPMKPAGIPADDLDDDGLPF